MSAKWKTIRLGEVLRLDLDRVPVSAGRNYPMVGVLSFGHGLFEREPIENGNTTYRVFNRIKAEHVIMSQLFGWEGALALSSERFAGKFLSPQFPTFLCDATKLDRNFLGWLMRRPTFWEDLGSRASGMGDRRRTLSPEALFECEISLPPLDEQQRIVAWVEQLASQIDKAQALRHQAIEDAEALCRSLLTNASATLTPMRELVELRPPDVVVRQDETYQFAGVYSFGRGVFRGTRKTGLDFVYPRLTRLRTGDFVYPKLMAWEGALGVVPPECDDCVVSTEFPVFAVREDRVFHEILDIYFRMPSVWPGISNASTGTNVRRRRLNPQDFLNYQMPLPQRAIQLTIKELRREVQTLNRRQAETAVELDALLPSVLSKAFAGKL
jgi:type I restriction enzyme S subunit